MNCRKYFMLIVISITFVTEVISQETDGNRLSVGIGITDFQDKDEFQSPYTYKGKNLTYNTVYASFRKKGKHVVGVSYSTGKISSVVSPDAQNQQLTLNYEYLRRLSNADGKHRLTPSIGLGAHAFANRINYLPGIEQPVNYITGAAYLTLNGDIQFRMSKKDVLSLQTSIPLVGAVHRPDFEINGKTFTGAAAFGRGGPYNISIEYRRQLTEKIGLSLIYRYAYFTFNQPRPITILQNGLSARITLKLK